jgi:hypothetical protein
MGWEHAENRPWNVIVRPVEAAAKQLRRPAERLTVRILPIHRTVGRLSRVEIGKLGSFR